MDYETPTTLANMKRLSGTTGLVAFSPTTHEEFSADYRDYWYLDDDEALIGEDGEPTFLVTVAYVIQAVEA